MSDQLTLLGFYLGMVTLLSATFFARIDGWYAEILSVGRQWENELRPGRPTPDAELSHTYRQRALALKSALPIRGFILVFLFLLVLSGMSVALGYSVDPSSSKFNFLLYVYVPGGLFLALFLGGASWFMYDGHQNKLKNLLKKIDSV